MQDEMLTPESIDSFLQQTYARVPILLERGEGSWVWDNNGRRYLDFVAGIATCSLGHASPAIIAALQRQAAELMHVSNLYYTRPQAELARWLVEHSFAARAFFCNSGAEANEAAIKLARKYSHKHYGSDEPVIITALQSFHGRTLAALTATGQKKYQAGFSPLVPGFEYVPYNDSRALEHTAARLRAESGRRLAAVLLEPIQGEGGVLPGTEEFFRTARAVCDSNDALLMFDEVQCGVGRTGSLWAYERLGVVPDVLTSAKGLGGGFPIGAMLANTRAAVLEPGEHASTFGGNPLAASVSLAVCNEIGNPAFLSAVHSKGELLLAGLSDLVERHPERLLCARGWGLMCGLVIRDDVQLMASDITKAALDKGLLLVGAGPKVVRFVPPLTVRPEEVSQALSVVEELLRV